MPANLDTDLSRLPCDPVRESSPSNGAGHACPAAAKIVSRGLRMGSVVKKRRKRMAKKKHRKLLRKTRVQRRRLGK